MVKPGIAPPEGEARAAGKPGEKQGKQEGYAARGGGPREEGATSPEHNGKGNKKRGKQKDTRNHDTRTHEGHT
jgi:hypothetical protein